MGPTNELTSYLSCHFSPWRRDSLDPKLPKLPQVMLPIMVTKSQASLEAKLRFIFRVQT